MVPSGIVLRVRQKKRAPGPATASGEVVEREKVRPSGEATKTLEKGVLYR
jgi:hypothetical protein